MRYVQASVVHVLDVVACEVPRTSRDSVADFIRSSDTDRGPSVVEAFAVLGH
jgi:hypothetical protein